MQRIRQRVVDCVHLGVSNHVGVGRQNAFDTVLFGEHLGAAPVAGCDGDQPMAELLCRADDGEVGDSGCTEHPDPQGHTGML